MAKLEWSMGQLTAKAEAYCATSEHCIYDVRLKLQQWEATEEQTDTIIAHLQEEQYIDETRYCRSFAHDKLHYQGWGRLKIKMHLQAKHLPANAIKDAVDALDETTYNSILTHLIETKERSIKSKDTNAKAKVIRFCLQRGFLYEEIQEAMSQMQ